MGKRELEILLERYKKGECTPMEVEAIERIFLTGLNDLGKISDEEIYELKRTFIEATHSIERPAKRALIVRMLPYAAAIACIGVILFFAAQRDESAKPEVPETVLADIAPGRDQAILTLEDGSVVNLEQHAGGAIASQGKVSITKSANGQLVYSTSGNLTENLAPKKYNTISTPRGGQFQVTLPDGSQVWLNSSSSITFATSFAAGRDVKLTGEAYFEVKHNATSPFTVQSGGQSIRVLGTHFNVNAYADEPNIRTTLLEGSVEVSARSASKRLQPGQASLFDAKGLSVQPAAPNAISWKNNEFKFIKSDIHSILRQVSRWYDVEVIYEKEIPSSELEITGGVVRSSRLSTLLSLLENFGVQFRLENGPKGKRLFVSPKEPGAKKS